MKAAYSTRAKRLVQLVAGLGSSIAPFLVASMVVAAPTIGVEFEAEVSLLGWLTAAFFLVAAALLVPMGRIADIRGSRRVFTAGMIVYLVSAVVCIFSPDIFTLIAGRALTGAGAAMVFGTSIALLSLVFPPDERGKAIGLNVTAMFGGFTIGLLAGGFVTFYITWRALFVVAGVLAAVVLLLVLSQVKGECELARTKDYDPPGMVLYSSGLLFAFYGLSEFSTSLGPYALVAGSMVLGAFYVWERRYPNPLIARRVARSREFLLAAGTNILFQAGAFAIPFLLSLHFQFVAELDARVAGFLLIIPQSLMTLTSPVSGRLTVRHSNYLVTGAGSVLNALGVGLLLTLSEGTSIIVLVLALALVGIGTGLFMPAVVNWALGGVAREDYGVASAFTETARLTGMTFSNVVIIVVFGLLLGAAPVSASQIPEFIEAARASALLYVIFSATSAAISFLMLRGRGIRALV